MDNQPLAPFNKSRIFGVVLLFGLVFFSSLWLGHRLGNTTRRVVLAAMPSSPEGARDSQKGLKHAVHSILHPKSAAQLGSTARQAEFSSQRNILVIGIDSFQSEEPRLEGVWIILYLRDVPHFILMPVYPNRVPGQEDSPLVDQNLAHLFQLEDGQAPDPRFLQALKDKQLWWDGYIILDKTALSEILALTSAPDDSTSNQLLASGLPDIEEAPMRALLEQTQLAQELCRNSGAVLASENTSFPGLIVKTAAIIRTDLNLEEIAGEVITALRSGGGISCEFPSLETAANLP